MELAALRSPAFGIMLDQFFDGCPFQILAVVDVHA